MMLPFVEYTQQTGKSINAFMLRAVHETMARDKEKKITA